MTIFFFDTEYNKNICRKCIERLFSNDLWELGRRNLIIYDDKKLGSGAFGAVFLGRLIGVAKGSKDAQSTLGVNLMRADNCDVAVKMLPGICAKSTLEFLQSFFCLSALLDTLGTFSTVLIFLTFHFLFFRVLTFSKKFLQKNQLLPLTGYFAIYVLLI